MAFRKSPPDGDYESPFLDRPHLSNTGKGQGRKEEGRVAWELEGLAGYLGLGHS